MSEEQTNPTPAQPAAPAPKGDYRTTLAGIAYVLLEALNTIPNWETLPPRELAIRGGKALVVAILAYMAADAKKGG